MFGSQFRSLAVILVSEFFLKSFRVLSEEQGEQKREMKPTVSADQPHALTTLAKPAGSKTSKFRYDTDAAAVGLNVFRCRFRYSPVVPKLQSGKPPDLRVLFSECE